MCRKIWRFIQYYAVPVILGLLATFLSIYYVSTLNKPEYAALVIALLGIFFTLWLAVIRDIANTRKNRLSILSQLNLELQQNRNALNSILVNEKEEEGSSNPAPLRINVWSAAITSPHFPWIKTDIVNDLLSIYGRIDTANYYADVFKNTTYFSGSNMQQPNVLSVNLQSLYVSIAKVALGQIDSVIARLSKEIENLN